MKPIATRWTNVAALTVCSLALTFVTHDVRAEHHEAMETKAGDGYADEHEHHHGDHGHADEHEHHHGDEKTQDEGEPDHHHHHGEG